MRLTAVALTLGLLSAACASAPLRPVDLSRVAAADARVLEGCYACLTEARDTYVRLAVGKARPALVTRLFESHVLVGLREAELAMDPAQSYAAAEALLAELPARDDAAQYLTIARAIPPDPVGATYAERSAWARGRFSGDEYTARKTLLNTGAGSAPFRAYLSAGLECLRIASGQRISAVPKIPDAAPPLVRYRMATCPAVIDAQLQVVATAVPAFVEAEWFGARLNVPVVTSAYTQRLRAALQAAFEQFPGSPSVTYGLGAFFQTIGDCKAAIRYYEATMTLKPLHEEAAMQRVICLGHLGEFASAIDGATRIIARDDPNTADAYYWRAWNHYQRKDLEAARRDIDESRARSLTIKALILGGMINYDQRALDLAEADLANAIAMDRGNQQCAARWYYGLVAFAREQWPDAATRFATAGDCYRNAADLARRELAAMQRADVDEDFRRSQIAGFKAAIMEDAGQEEASYLNTANCHALSGRIAEARQWLAKVPPDSIHAPSADQVRKLIGGGVSSDKM